LGHGSARGVEDHEAGGELADIEGNPRSPINQGTLCPKGSASRQLVE
jgi:anaerobic selenocysteine-containing dehydrogenase